MQYYPQPIPDLEALSLYVTIYSQTKQTAYPFKGYAVFLL